MFSILINKVSVQTPWNHRPEFLFNTSSVKLLPQPHMTPESVSLNPSPPSPSRSVYPRVGAQTLTPSVPGTVVLPRPHRRHPRSSSTNKVQGTREDSKKVWGPLLTRLLSVSVDRLQLGVDVKSKCTYTRVTWRPTLSQVSGLCTLWGNTRLNSKKFKYTTSGWWHGVWH